MRFTTPWFFALSICLVIVVLFYLFRKQFEPYVTSSNLLWEQVMQEYQATKWHKKLQRQLLLLLQLLILALLMLAMADPFIKQQGIAGEQAIVVLDTSASMSAEVNDKTAFAQSQEALLKFVEKRRHDQGVTVITMGQKPTIVLQDETNTRKIESTVNNLRIDYSRPSVDSALQLASALASTSSSTVHVYSDALTEETLGDGWEVPIAVHNIERTTVENVYVSSFGVRATTDNDRATGLVEVKQSIQGESNIELQVWAGNDLIYEKTHSFSGVDPLYIEIDNVPSANVYKAVVSSQNDAVSADNTRYAFSSESVSAPIYAVGEVNPFVAKVYQQLGHEVVFAKSVAQLDPDRTAGLTVVANLPPDDWPTGPKLILSPTKGGPFQVEEAVVIAVDIQQNASDELMTYVDLNDLFISKANPTTTSLEPVVSSGDVPLIQSGHYNGDPVVLLNFAIEDSDWPLRSSFPVFFYNALQHLTSKNEHLGYLYPGELLELPVLEENEAYVFNEDNDIIQNVTGEIETTTPVLPGLYHIQSQGQPIYFTVQMPVEESELEIAPSFNRGEGSDPSMAVAEMIDDYIWVWFIVIALVIVIIEGEVYRRGIRVS
ncbi:vWA domain-containing protein [Aureibacillus halotolerans]|uniref:Putative membrane protein (TIGR02226 family) n=1 Tax=Aureibacillus halotolerans TaxID=1508390 RepID=A0A4R6U2W7_9BACI|nr:VWA domain-containing protein [Aureibacillus halotolerans]TDQ40341.1 putative membrane protein (TIGR02226 family) [Aureibacillus halotolerans]